MKVVFGLAVLIWSGCLPVEPMIEVRIQGDVESSESGAVELWLLHRSYGQGELQTKLAVIATLKLDNPQSFDWQVLVPTDAGDGLSLYAWQDHNGDGAHCLPGTQTESATTIMLPPAAEFTIRAELELEPSCAGPFLDSEAP